ncbi:hypothetical protein CONCODRAFT_2666 [Conidiobolus coronatus NRRL 28638]|uniref:Uncharacterized protein n=1 Tax=Conidiobolus coronatus (strain ATCC 28846 / CBS 209.66 / NRRL 28638) TaxID=796925 RepID=A0A137PH06_CONC2|nr:hypothetical protein CONCODRAFT_2666 [Conidiobolus coronatus NRRL 28638]|eukprot:KXN74287.1 hypothetical protein CONCODRAFT_2666 [Conidiobolus coronatus NRRL 28638]
MKFFNYLLLTIPALAQSTCKNTNQPEISNCSSQSSPFKLNTITTYNKQLAGNILQIIDVNFQGQLSRKLVEPKTIWKITHVRPDGNIVALGDGEAPHYTNGQVYNPGTVTFNVHIEEFRRGSLNPLTLELKTVDKTGEVSVLKAKYNI